MVALALAVKRRVLIVGCIAAVCVASAYGTRGVAPVVVSRPSLFSGCNSPPAFENAEVEPSLAVDPRSPMRLVGAYQQDRFHVGGARGIVAALSEDSGRTWKAVALPLSECAGPGGVPGALASDPWVSVGADSEIYVSSLVNPRDRATAVTALTSRTWGRTWSRPRLLGGIHGLADKPSITADPTQPGRAYLIWSDYYATDPPGTESDELFSRTQDGGKTWSRPTVVLDHAKRSGPEDGQVLVDSRTGRLYALMAWVRGGSATPDRPAWMMISHSDDGGAHWSSARRFAVGAPALQRSDTAIRSSPQVPSFAIDARGVIYATWQDSRFSHGRHTGIAFVRSLDGGAHFSAPRLVGGGGRAGGILPTLAADARGGTICLLYLSLAAADAKPRSHYRILRSTNNGRTFRAEDLTPDFALTDAPRLTGSPLVPGGYFLGDYMGVVSLRQGRCGSLYVGATGKASNKTDVFYAATG
jgi:hypothetical protein